MHMTGARQKDLDSVWRLNFVWKLQSKEFPLALNRFLDIIDRFLFRFPTRRASRKRRTFGVKKSIFILFCIDQ